MTSFGHHSNHDFVSCVSCFCHQLTEVLLFFLLFVCKRCSYKSSYHNSSALAEACCCFDDVPCKIHHLNNSQEQWVSLRCLFHKFCIKGTVFSSSWNMERLFWKEGKGIKRSMQNSERTLGKACCSVGLVKHPAIWLLIELRKPPRPSSLWRTDSARYPVFPASCQTPNSLISAFLTVFSLYLCFQLWTEPRNLSAKFKENVLKNERGLFEQCLLIWTQLVWTS